MGANVLNSSTNNGIIMELIKFFSMQIVALFDHKAEATNLESFSKIQNSPKLYTIPAAKSIISVFIGVKFTSGESARFPPICTGSNL